MYVYTHSDMWISEVSILISFRLAQYLTRRDENLIEQAPAETFGCNDDGQ